MTGTKVTISGEDNSAMHFSETDFPKEFIILLDL
jgi:hypothetical protein